MKKKNSEIQHLMKVFSKRSSVYFTYMWVHSTSLRLYQGASAFPVFNPLHNTEGCHGCAVSRSSFSLDCSSFLHQAMFPPN